MRPIFHAELVNGAFGDPGVYVDLKFERRALLSTSVTSRACRHASSFASAMCSCRTRTWITSPASIICYAFVSGACRKAHLTARQAGEIAREAHVKQAVPFHFSPRYLGREDELREEFAASRAAGR